MDCEADLGKLLKLCFDVIESQKGKSIPPDSEWKSDAQALGVKIFRHVASAQHLSVGVSFDYGEKEKFSYVDHSSVAVIVRAAVESFLAFNYIFTCEDVNLAKYRHKTWRLSGLIERGKLYGFTTEAKKVLLEEALCVEELRGELLSDKFFLDSNRDTKKRTLGGGWKPAGGWYVISEGADIHKRYFSDIYNHLSGHSHSSYISAIQTRDANTVEHQQMLAGSARQVLCLILAHFLFSYVRLFPDASPVLEADGSLFEVAKLWYIKKADAEFVYD